MIKKSGGKEIYTFSHSTGYIFVVNHLGKFLLAGILIAVLAVYKGNLNPTDLIYPALFLFILYYFVESLLRKNAYKISINLETRKIKFYMNRSGDIIISDFDDVKDIIVNFHIILHLREKKILYNDLQNNELLKCLNKIKKIHWGKMCALWGPSKNIRDTLES